MAREKVAERRAREEAEREAAREAKWEALSKAEKDQAALNYAEQSARWCEHFMGRTAEKRFMANAEEHGLAYAIRNHGFAVVQECESNRLWSIFRDEVLYRNGVHRDPADALREAIRWRDGAYLRSVEAVTRERTFSDDRERAEAMAMGFSSKWAESVAERLAEYLEDASSSKFLGYTDADLAETARRENEMLGWTEE